MTAGAGRPRSAIGPWGRALPKASAATAVPNSSPSSQEAPSSTPGPPSLQTKTPSIASVAPAAELDSVRGRWTIQIVSSGPTEMPATWPSRHSFGRRCGQSGTTRNCGAAPDAPFSGVSASLDLGLRGLVSGRRVLRHGRRKAAMRAASATDDTSRAERVSLVMGVFLQFFVFLVWLIPKQSDQECQCTLLAWRNVPARIEYVFPLVGLRHPTSSGGLPNEGGENLPSGNCG
jgi:hypothetical protein